jgi:predicted metal-dependent HD superfamily phosphohydrolase
VEHFLSVRIFSATEAKEDTVARLPQDKDRIERATRESQTIIDLERQAREAKTARLREQRLSAKAPASAKTAKHKPIGRKTTGKTSDVR